MSHNPEIAWHRSYSTGDDEHWLSVAVTRAGEASGPLDIVVLLDTSRSMVGERMTFAHAVTTLLVERLSTQDQVAVWSFGAEPRLLYKGCGGALPTGALSNLTCQGGTRMDSALDALDGWVTLGAGTKRIIMVTDGGPTDVEGKRVPNARIIGRVRSLMTQGVTVSTVAVGQLRHSDLQFLKEVADVGQGMAVVSSDPDALVACLSEGKVETSRCQVPASIIISGPGLGFLEAWEVAPSVRALSVDRSATNFVCRTGSHLLLRLHWRAPLGVALGPVSVGSLVLEHLDRTEEIPLELIYISPSAQERFILNEAVDALRVRVELAKCAERRSRETDPSEQLRLTRHLVDLSQKLGDPRATVCFGGQLEKMERGETVTSEDDNQALQVARGISDGA